MLIDAPLFNGFSLKMSNTSLGNQDYPTTYLQKGLILFDHAQGLDEEGVGFGVPLLKRGLNTVFPGSVDFSTRQEQAALVINAKFNLNLVEKFATEKDGFVENKLLYDTKNLLAATIRRLPIARKSLTSTSNLLRKTFNWKTTYADAGFSEAVNVEYRIEGATGKLQVAVDAGSLSPEVTEVIVMNEQGARIFNHYRDSSGLFIKGDAIGCWDEVNAEKAWFESAKHKIAFKLSRVHETHLFRGRELVNNRLAWAGFGYSFQPSVKKVLYELEIEQMQ